MTIIEVSMAHLDGAVALLGPKVVAFSRAKNWIVVFHSDADDLVRILVRNGIDGKLVDRALLQNV